MIISGRVRCRPSPFAPIGHAAGTEQFSTEGVSLHNSWGLSEIEVLGVHRFNALRHRRDLEANAIAFLRILVVYCKNAGTVST